MTPNGAQPETNREERAFDAFLDALACGTAELAGERNGPLAETARWVQALAETDASKPPVATLAAIREDLMGAHKVIATSVPAAHASGSTPRYLRAASPSAVARRPRWLIANGSLAAIVVLTLGLGLLAYRLGPGAPSADHQEGLPAGVMVSSPASEPSTPVDLANIQGAYGTSATYDEYFADCKAVPDETDGCDLDLYLEPGAETCTVAPRSQEDLTLIKNGTSPRTTQNEEKLSIRAPVDVEGTRPSIGALDAIGRTVQDVFTCLTLGQDLRAYTLFTDAALLAMQEQTSLLPAQTLLRYGPREPQAILHASQLANGYVVARLHFGIYNGYLQETWTFKQENGRYLVRNVALAVPIATNSWGPAGLLDCLDSSKSQPGCDRATVDVPDPSECVVGPRTINEVAALFASSGAVTVRPVAEGTPADAILTSSGTMRLLENGTPSDARFDPEDAPGTPVAILSGTPTEDVPSSLAALPGGPAPDERTAAAVNATWRQYFACGNAGDYLRLTALFTDLGFQRAFVINAEVLSGGQLRIAPTGGLFPADESSSYLPLIEMRVLPDGRVGALIDVKDASQTPSDGGNWVVFVNIDGRWLIDDLSLTLME